MTRATTAAGSPEPPPGGAEALFPLNTNDIAPTQRGAVLETGAWCRSNRPEAQTTVTRSPPRLPSRGAAGPATSGLASARGGPSTRAADRAASTRRSSLRTTRSTGDLYYTRCGEVRRRCCQLCHRGVAAVAGLVPPWRHGPTLPVNKLMSNLDKWLKSGRSNGYS